MLIGVWSSSTSGVYFPFAAFALGGVAESFVPGAAVKSTLASSEVLTAFLGSRLVDDV